MGLTQITVADGDGGRKRIRINDILVGIESIVAALLVSACN